MEQISDLGELLSLKKTCEILNVHPNTLRQWDRKGILKAVRFGQRKDRHYKKGDILRLLDTRDRGGSSPDEKLDHDYISYDNRKIIAEAALERLRLLQHITASLSKAITQEEVADVIIRQRNNVDMCEGVAVFRIDKGLNSLALLGYASFAESVVKSWERTDLKNSNPLSDCLKTGEPLIIESSSDYLVKHSLTGYLPHFTKSQALAILPMTVDNRVFGVIIFGFNEPQKFDKNDVSFFLSIVNQCSQAFERASLYELEKKARRDAEETKATLEDAYNAFLKFLVPLTAGETYQTVVTEAIKLMGADYGSLFLNVNDKVKKVYSTLPILYKVGSRPYGYGNNALHSNQILINQINKDEYHKLLVELGIKTIIYIPMSYQNKTTGLVTLNFLNRKYPGDRELSILRLYGSMASLAIDRCTAH